MSFGEKLQKLRRQAGLSQEELAGQLGVSRQAVSRWELEGVLPDAGKIVALSRIFSVSTDYLLKDELEIPETATTPPEISRQPAEVVPAKKVAGKGFLIAACITGGLGLLGFLVIAVLSSMIEVYGTIVTHQDGITHYTGGWTYSFTAFVETYRLQAILWILGILTVIGFFLFWNWLEKYLGSKKAEENTNLSD